MLNIDVAVNTFWQFARCWKTSETAKLELTCQNGFLQLNMSTSLGHPDLLHFPPPPPPQPPTPPLQLFKVKTPSQLKREDRRKQERSNENDSNFEEIKTTVEVKNTQFLSNTEFPNNTLEMLQPTCQMTNCFKCDKCDYKTESIDNLNVHKTQSHPEAITSYFSENCESSLSKTLLKKQDFGGYAHPPYEPSFTHCLLRGAGCLNTASQYISTANIAIKNQKVKTKHVYTCKSCTKYISLDQDSKCLPLGSKPLPLPVYCPLSTSALGTP